MPRATRWPRAGRSIGEPSWHHSSARPYSMIKAENTVLLLLAAGRSQRFGDADKLEQDYLGHPLAFHVVTALEGKRMAEIIRSEEHTSELQSLMRISSAVFCLQKTNNNINPTSQT